MVINAVNSKIGFVGSHISTRFYQLSSVCYKIPLKKGFIRDFSTDQTIRDVIGRKKIQAPRTVDFNVNGACNLNCTWCWGPDHKAKEDLSNQEWKETALKLRNLGTVNITFTGGEPLMKEGFEDIVSYIRRDLGIRTTLSTNGILLKRKSKQILPYIDDIGLPLDGHLEEVVRLMRAGSTPKYFDRVLGVIKVIQTEYPKIDLTIRTVVSSKNLESVPLIGKTLLGVGINAKNVRWKLYQVAPIGMRKEDVLNGDWLITDAQFQETAEKTRKLNLEFSNISILPLKGHTGRYFHIYPDGKTHIFMTGKDGFPAHFPTGNIRKNFDSVIKTLQLYDLGENDVR